MYIINLVEIAYDHCEIGYDYGNDILAKGEIIYTYGDDIQSKGLMRYKPKRDDIPNLRFG